MNFDVIKYSEIHESNITRNDQNPAFRKATVNMIAADFVCKSVLESLPENSKNDLGFVLGTRFGEIRSTLEFLSAYDQNKPLSPIHFQNSLHNSTLGFLCINHKITGPALTISAGSNTEQALMDTAHAISLSSSYILICTVDSIPESLKENYFSAHPELKKHDGWARAFLLKVNESAKSFNIGEYIK